MKNNRPALVGVAERSNRPGFGPSASAVRPIHGLSRSRASLLQTLRDQSEPTSLAALSLATGLHANTIREHLDALMDAGLVARQAEPARGRGRPAWLYEATDPGPVNEYARLASALAVALGRGSDSPVDDAARAGRSWGRELAREVGPAAPSATAARRQVIAILDDLGFAPETDRRAGRVRLTRCPLLESARAQPDIVCAVHLGLVQGALDERGGDPDRATLTPFAEPGACLLRLDAQPSPDGPA